MGVPACAVIPVILNRGFKRVACRGLQALPRGSAHGPINGSATSLGSIGSKSVWAPPNTAGNMVATRIASLSPRDGRGRILLPGSADRLPRASKQFYAAAASTSIVVARRMRFPGRRGPGARARSNSCARLSAAVTAMRSAPLTLPPARISCSRRSRNATASMELGALAFLAGDFVVAAEQRHVERDGPLGRRRRPCRHAVNSGSRASNASSRRVASSTRSQARDRGLGAREVTPQRFVRRAQRRRVGKRAGHPLLERGKLRVERGVRCRFEG